MPLAQPDHARASRAWRYRANVRGLRPGSLSGVLEHLGDFRGDSRFTTWAYKFAVNAALIAARRERWGRIPLDRLLENPNLAARLQLAGSDSPDPLKSALRHEALVAIRDGIEQQLSVRRDSY